MPLADHLVIAPGATHFLTLNHELVTRLDARTDGILVLRPTTVAARGADARKVEINS